MIERFEIVTHNAPRPNAERILFCDGTGGGILRPETDLDLSHWRPNTTPEEYRAGTSTEICLRFLDHPRPGVWTAAVNNHVDVDGILSVYVLVHAKHALAHRRTIIEAAEIGDFWGWGDRAAQRVFQGITHVMGRCGGRAAYEEAFRRIPALIDGTDPELPQIDASLAPLNRSADLVAQGKIARSVIGPRLAHFVIPHTIAGDDDAQAAYSPEFNEAISDKALLWPQVRAGADRERICLVSTERSSGWFHDIWFPGYLWADTVGLWQVPGLTYHDGMASYSLEHPPLLAAFAELQHREPAPGDWGLGGTSLPHGEVLQGRFPLVGRFVDARAESAASRLPPEIVADCLKDVFSESVE